MIDYPHDETAPPGAVFYRVMGCPLFGFPHWHEVEPGKGYEFCPLEMFDLEVTIIHAGGWWFSHSTMTLGGSIS